MKYDADVWQAGPSDDVLSDPAVRTLGGREFLFGAQRLAFQLRVCLDVRTLLAMWDSESTPAWQAVTGHAGGIIQRTLVKELTLTTSHLLDATKDASSLVNFHRQSVESNLVPGPFKSFYLPLYRAIIEKGKKIKPLRDGVIAHTNQEGLASSLGQSIEKKPAGDLNIGDLDRLLSMISQYVTLLHRVLGIGTGQFERKIDGADELRLAVMAAYSSAT